MLYNFCLNSDLQADFLDLYLSWVVIRKDKELSTLYLYTNGIWNLKISFKKVGSCQGIYNPVHSNTDLCYTLQIFNTKY
jgi:hypothetical protein